MAILYSEIKLYCQLTEAFELGSDTNRAPFSKIAKYTDGCILQVDVYQLRKV